MKIFIYICVFLFAFTSGTLADEYKTSEIDKRKLASKNIYSYLKEIDYLMTKIDSFRLTKDSTLGREKKPETLKVNSVDSLYVDSFSGCSFEISGVALDKNSYIKTITPVPFSLKFNFEEGVGWSAVKKYGDNYYIEFETENRPKGLDLLAGSIWKEGRVSDFVSHDSKPLFKITSYFRQLHKSCYNKK